MQITSVDMAMYDLVLGVLSQDPEFYPWRRSREPGGIGPCVLNHTAKVDADILEWTLDSTEQTDIPDGPLIIGDILARNTLVASLEYYTPLYGAALITRDQISKHFNNRK